MKINEIYCRMPTDINYVENRLSTTDDIENILQRIRMILGTQPGQVLGSPYFGVDLYQYLFAMNLDTKQIKELLDEHINTCISPFYVKYNVHCEVSYGHDRENRSDYALIDIFINDNKTLGIVVTS